MVGGPCASMRPQHGPTLRYAPPSPLCNLIRSGSVKEFAQCFRAQAVGLARAANTCIVQGDKLWEAQTSRNRTALYKACMTAAGFNP